MKKENKTITLKDVNTKIDKLAKSVKDIIKRVKKLEGALTSENKVDATCETIKYPDLSTLTEIGTIVDIGVCKIRLLDTDYNGTGLKIWQTTEVLYPNEVELKTIDNNRICCFYNSKGLMDVLLKFERKLPGNIRKQLVTTLVPCYFPEEKNIQNTTASVFLLSSTEMCQNKHHFPCEGRPLEYYIHNVPVINDFHWLRTPHRNRSDYWCCVSTASNVFECCTNEKLGIAPAFCTK